MNVLHKLQRVPPAGWAAILGAALVLPGLGSFGFWDPWELGVADRAREIARSGKLFDVTLGGRHPAEPPLDLALAALGIRLFGAGELGARLVNGLAAIGALLALAWAGSGLLRRRAAALGAAALATMPLFLLQARQLTSDMPAVAGLALAMAGLGRFAWPADGRRRWRDLAAALAGMGIGLASAGALLGVALPCLALAGALVAGWSLRVAPAAGGESEILSPSTPGPDLPADRTLGGSLLARGVRGRAWLALLALAGVALLVLTLLKANVAGRFSLLLGGVPRAGEPAQMFEYLARQLGFGLFPWCVLGVFALGRAFVRLGEGDEADGGRLAFVQIYLLVFAAFGFALSTVFVLMTGEARFAALAPIALAVGAFLDEGLDGRRAEPVLGLVVATGTMVVARDFFLAPEEIASVHILGGKVKWPPTLQLGFAFLAVGLVAGAGVYAGLAMRGRALAGGPAAPDGAGRVRRVLGALAIRAGRWGLQAAVAAAIAFALFLAYAVVPMLSRHLSFKPVFESYARFAKAGEEIGRYRVEGHGAGFYGARTLVDIPTQDRLLEFLRQPRRAFSLVPAEELAPLDVAFKLGRIEYFVVDASSSRFLLLSNRLGGGEADANPLKNDVWMAPRLPEVVPAGAAGAELKDPKNPKEAKVEWHGQAPPWKWRVPAHAVYENAVELLGAEYPAEIRRPGKIPLTLFFRVHARPPAGFKLFVHFDAPGEPRLIGDHHPLGGTFGTAHWLPGEYIRDRHDVDVPLMTTPAGTYTLLVGFWPGGEGKRYRITGGANDGADRARIGTIEVK